MEEGRLGSTFVRELLCENRGRKCRCDLEEYSRKLSDQSCWKTVYAVLQLLPTHPVVSGCVYLTQGTPELGSCWGVLCARGTYPSLATPVREGWQPLGTRPLWDHLVHRGLVDLLQHPEFVRNWDVVGDLAHKQSWAKFLGTKLAAQCSRSPYTLTSLLAVHVLEDLAWIVTSFLVPAKWAREQGKWSGGRSVW